MTVATAAAWRVTVNSSRWKVRQIHSRAGGRRRTIHGHDIGTLLERRVHDHSPPSRHEVRVVVIDDVEHEHVEVVAMRESDRTLYRPTQRRRPSVRLIAPLGLARRRGHPRCLDVERRSVSPHRAILWLLLVRLSVESDL